LLIIARFLARSCLGDLAPLAGMAELEHLDVSGTRVSDLTPILVTDVRLVHTGLSWAQVGVLRKVMPKVRVFALPSGARLGAPSAQRLVRRHEGVGAAPRAKASSLPGRAPRRWMPARFGPATARQHANCK
jgi:hypothetical protein